MRAHETGARSRVGTTSASKLTRALGVVVLGAVASACTVEDEKKVLPPIVLGMLETTRPSYDDGRRQIFQVGREVRLPYRQPYGEQPRGEQDPYPRPPFHVTTDSRVTVRYTLSNLEDREHAVELLLDPWNEFVRYVPGVTATHNAEVQPNVSGIDRFVVLPPKGRVEGILTPDDMVELATDLTVAMALERRPPDASGPFGGPVLYNRTFDSQSRSNDPDPILQDWLPRPGAKIAAVIGFDVGLRTSAPAKIAVELDIDIEDLNGGRVLIDGEQGRPIDRPAAALSPPAGGASM